MNDLRKMYRKAPTLETPAGLDQRLLAAARARAQSGDLNNARSLTEKPLQPQSEPRTRALSRRWQMAGYAIASVCMFGIGFGVLLQSGWMPTRNNDITTDGSSVAEADLRQRNTSGLSSIDQLTRESATDLVLDSADTATSTSAGTSTSISTSTSDSADIVMSDELPQSDSRLQQSVPVASMADAPAPDRSSAELFLAESDGSTTAAAASSTSAEELSTATSALTDSVASADSVASLSSESIAQESLNATDAKSAPQAISNDNAIASFSKAAPDKNSAHIPEASAWLVAQNPGHYTVQVAPLANREFLTRISAMIPKPTRLVATGNGDWLLLHGSFADTSAAEQALFELVKSIILNPEAAAAIAPEIVAFKEILQRVE